MNTWMLTSRLWNCEKGKKKPYLRRAFAAIISFSAALFFGSALLVLDHAEVPMHSEKLFGTVGWAKVVALQESIAVQGNTNISTCEAQYRRYGNVTLPKAIITPTTNLDMKPLWGKQEESNKRKSLLAMAVGIRQKDNVNKIINKFPSSDFAVMLFHYDGKVDEWKDLVWNDRVVHISAVNQTKWWYARAFLHPDIVSDYEYIILWDEALGVDNFDAERYFSVVRKEGFEISQPVLQAKSYGLLHRFSRRLLRPKLNRFVEMTAPVFSKASWSCAWHMIENDAIR